MSTTIATTYHVLVEENSNKMTYPNVSDLPGLLLHVVLALHSAVDHQTT